MARMVQRRTICLMRRTMLPVLALVLALPLVAFPSSPAEPVPLAPSFRVGDTHPVYPAYRWNGSEWVRTVSETVDVNYPVRTTVADDAAPAPVAGQAWRAVMHTNTYSRVVTDSGRYWDPNGGTFVIAGYNQRRVPNPSTCHRDSAHTCTGTRQVQVCGMNIPDCFYTECVARATECHSHGSTIGWEPYGGMSGEWVYWSTSWTEWIDDTCPMTNDCGGHSKPGEWAFRSHRTEWERDNFVRETRTSTVACGSACTLALAPVLPPHDDGASSIPGWPVTPEFDMSWRVDVVAPYPILAQGSFSEAEVSLLRATLLCDGLPCDDPSLYSGDDFLVRPRPGRVTGRLEFDDETPFRLCADPLSDPACQAHVISDLIQGRLDASPSGRLRVSLLTPALSADDFGLRLTESDGRAEMWEWEQDFEFVDDGPCQVQPDGSGCLRSGEYVPVGEPLPVKVELAGGGEKVDVTVRLLRPDGSVVGEYTAGSFIPLATSGTSG